MRHKQLQLHEPQQLSLLSGAPRGSRLTWELSNGFTGGDAAAGRLTYKAFVNVRLDGRVIAQLLSNDDESLWTFRAVDDRYEQLERLRKLPVEEAKRLGTEVLHAMGVLRKGAKGTKRNV